MTVPHKTSTSLLGIRRELGDDNYFATTSYSNISLTDMSNSDVETINELNPPSVRPDEDTPHGMGEWRGYDHDFGGTAANTWAADITNGVYTNAGALNYQRGWEDTSLGSISAGTSGYESQAGDGSTYPRYTTATGFTYAYITGIWWRRLDTQHTTPRLYIRFANESITGGTPNWSSFKITGSEMGAKSSFTGPTSSGNNTYYIDRATNPFDETVGSIHDIKITGAGWTASATAPTGVGISTSGVQWNQFSASGTISSDGGAPVTGKGFVYSTSNSSPTIGGSGVTQVTDGTGTANYSEILPPSGNFSACQTVYVRAYATNSVGTTYSSVATVQTTRRPHTFKYATGKFGGATVCSSTNTVTLYAQSDNSTNLVIQQGTPVYTSATCGNSAQPSGVVWYSDGFHNGRWTGTAWTLISSC